MLHSYMNIKRKKMNFSMMVLTDCISLKGSNKDLIDYIYKVGEIFEIRAVAYKDLSSSHKANNLYNYWHIWKKGEEDANLNSVSMRNEFYQFIEEYCKELLDKY